MISLTEDAKEKLDKLSLVSFVGIWNSFTGLNMTRILRIWHCDAEIRIGNPVKFSNHHNDLSVAIEHTYIQMENHILDDPKLAQYWDEE